MSDFAKYSFKSPSVTADLAKAVVDVLSEHDLATSKLVVWSRRDVRSKMPMSKQGHENWKDIRDSLLDVMPNVSTKQYWSAIWSVDPGHGLEGTPFGG